MKFIVPISLTTLLVTQFITDLRTPYEGYPAWALGIGWLVVLIPVGIMVGPLLVQSGHRRIQRQ